MALADVLAASFVFAPLELEAVSLAGRGGGDMSVLGLEAFAVIDLVGSGGGGISLCALAARAAVILRGRGGGGISVRALEALAASALLASVHVVSVLVA